MVAGHRIFLHYRRPHTRSPSDCDHHGLGKTDQRQEYYIKHPPAEAGGCGFGHISDISTLHRPLRQPVRTFPEIHLYVSLAHHFHHDASNE